ncbi:helix-hairpin-helix domain-containing protein [Antrihabitans stalactiti]|uniref:ComEA family DNA-binding protein n=1 Tax=Antrihabitans stalactiti TaxID=2584121 RepID=A0A848K6D8_9NOCA|nr:helix-hairpin-helix domain-containing protein [Antrihabitans stalactiti]NMN94595.1 ComEA family DNA-binding protein [Antrihabitans stalactiti]
MRSIEERDRVRSRLGAVTGGREPEVVADLDDAERTPEWLDLGPEPRGRSSWLPERLRGARFDPGRPGAVTLALVGVVVVVIVGVVFLLERPQQNAVPALPAVSASVSASPVETSTPPAPAMIVVSVVGLVHTNGLVRLPEGSRIADAITAAGGAQEGADLLSLNMAQRLMDGDQVLVGVASTDGGPPVLGSGTVSSGTAAAPGPASRGKVNLNSATEEELDALPGVGPVTAAAIVAWRSVNGRFTDVEQLGEVEGIGPARLAKLRELVTI